MKRSPSPARTPGRSPGPLPAALRPVLLAALAVLTLWIALRHPVARQEEWPPPQRFEPQDAVCEQARAEREWTFFTVPDAVGFTTPAEVGRKFSLDTAWLCRANGRDADCGSDRLVAGEELVLPLHSKAVEAARLARREASGRGGEAGGHGGG